MGSKGRKDARPMDFLTQKSREEPSVCCSVSDEVPTDGRTGPCSPKVKSIGRGLASTLAPQITLGYRLSRLR